MSRFHMKKEYSEPCNFQIKVIITLAYIHVHVPKLPSKVMG